MQNLLVQLISNFSYSRVTPNTSFLSFWVFVCLFVFLELYLRQMEIPRLGVEVELQLPAYATAYSNTRSLMDWVRPGTESASSWTLCLVLNPLNHNRNSPKYFLHCILILMISNYHSKLDIRSYNHFYIHFCKIYHVYYLCRFLEKVLLFLSEKNCQMLMPSINFSSTI